MIFDTIDLLDSSIVPKISCIYFVYNKNNLIYIGSTYHANSRITLIRFVHDFLNFGFSHVLIIPFNENNIREIEAILINWFDPIGNRHKTTVNSWARRKHLVPSE